MTINAASVALIQFPQGISQFPLSHPSLPRGTPPLVPLPAAGFMVGTPQPCTMVNASSHLAVPTPSAFNVGASVQIDRSANGFQAAVNYYVVTVASAYIEVATTVGGTALAATGAQPVNVAESTIAGWRVALVDLSQIPLGSLLDAGFTVLPIIAGYPLSIVQPYGVT